MNQPKQISDIELALYELRKIRRDIARLENFLSSKIETDERPRSKGLVHPKTGKVHQIKSSENG